MKLLCLRVAGFGPLQGEFAFDPDRLTLLVDENERGKSSLLAAVSAALYGLEGDRRTHRTLTPLERWRPWNNGPFGVELEFESGGERYTTKRDFERGTVEVWNSRGQEVTAEFLHGKDDYPVGSKLFGLDVTEWEKCAFVRQGELDLVVPGDEKARRSSTLHARLESAADTRVGDTNATEAVRVLDAAAAAYTCDELGSTMKVDNAIKGLEARRVLLESEIKTLEHDFEQIRGPLEELARRGEEERGVRAALARLDAERRSAISGEMRRALEENDRRCAELAQLREEAESLSSVSHLPEGAESELRETIARQEEAQRNLEGLETRRRDEQNRERRALEEEAERLEPYVNCTADDADRFVAVASEIRRLGEEDSRLKDAAFSHRETLASRGYEPERIQQLRQRFAGVTEDQDVLLRGQAEMALGFQTEVATLEQTRTASSEALREIDAARNARRLPGWFTLALGLGGALAGIVVLALNGLPVLSYSLVVISGIAVVVGLLLLRSGALTGLADREAALRTLAEAQRKLNQLRTRRHEAEVGLGELCRTLGYRDSVELMREWTEFNRLMEDSAPAIRAQERLALIEAKRRQVLDEARALLGRVGGGSPDPTNLERISAAIRHRVMLQQRLEELEASWSWIDDEKRVAEAAASGLRERAIRILQSAGLTYDPERPWADHVTELSERLRGRARYTLLIDQLIPQAEQRVLSDPDVAERRSQLAMVEAEPIAEGPAGDKPARGQVEIDAEVRRYREKLESLQKWHADLRVGVEESFRRHHIGYPEKRGQLERACAALERARRYKAALDLARETIQKVALETHRRWAEHLNSRVIELLRPIGTDIRELRFGEDLDFSVRLANGHQIARGKAVLQLSSGARDQLHLAVRLAISEYLSRDQESLPLLIDDAFATSDDERARAGMRLLIEHLAKQHQIVVVTCHRKRHEALAALDPELYAERVRWQDLGAKTPTQAR
ncbi:MAG: hypothetical protein A2W00_02170 [Candidatus Eisenbacteria bacterium RBG_16_71_46]|nr:MAG: hypothetical protein A2W00_02170 [Candidatus Eisenbacteria bacterium RBG_16_71_46]